MSTVFEQLFNLFTVINIIKKLLATALDFSALVPAIVSTLTYAVDQIFQINGQSETKDVIINSK